MRTLTRSLQSFPYAMADAVFCLFYYFVPGSRNRYDHTFKLKVNILVVRLLVGMDLSPVTVQTISERLFPDESPEQLQKSDGEKHAHDTTARRSKSSQSRRRSSHGRRPVVRERIEAAADSSLAQHLLTV